MFAVAVGHPPRDIRKRNQCIEGQAGIFRPMPADGAGNNGNARGTSPSHHQGWRRRDRPSIRSCHGRRNDRESGRRFSAFHAAATKAGCKRPDFEFGPLAFAMFEQAFEHPLKRGVTPGGLLARGTTASPHLASGLTGVSGTTSAFQAASGRRYCRASAWMSAGAIFSISSTSVSVWGRYQGRSTA